MTRAHANAHWQRICRDRDARADEDLRANCLRDADRERIDRAHERIEQRQLADQILARDLRAIHEEAERRQEYHAAGDANFDRLQVCFRFRFRCCFFILCTKLTHHV
jgi:hypothetical protein